MDCELILFDVRGGAADGARFIDMDHDLLVFLEALAVILGLFLAGSFVFVASLRIAVRMDFDRIRYYITSRGGRMRSCQRAFFGKGWMGSGNERIYEIRYTEANGSEHDATCKTSLFSGVYFTEDRIISAAKTPPPFSSSSARMLLLEEENRRLREELEKLKTQFVSR